MSGKGKVLDVYCCGKQVGTLAEMPDKRIAFQYSSDWQKDGFSINPLSLKLSNDVYVPPERTRYGSYGLFGVFADSLPDAWGQLLLDRYLNSVGIDSGDLTILDRLAYVGDAGFGALEYRPSKVSDYNVSASGLDYDEISEECHNILSSKPSDKLDVIFKLAGSSGGTRPKILINEDGKDWIIKFPAEVDSDISGEQEYMYSLCAKKCGIPMTDTELVKSRICNGYFKTSRFDRQGDDKVFCLTFAGALDADHRTPSCDYSDFMKLVRVFTKDNKIDKEQMFDQMCFNVLTHNRDDHTRNFSFVRTDSGQWKLAPAYDITYSNTYYGEHTTSVNGKGKDITDMDLMAVGMGAGLSEKVCKDHISNIRQNISMLTTYIDNVPLRTKDVSVTERLNEIISDSNEHFVSQSTWDYNV